MKSDYVHDQMVETIILRVFPELKDDLQQLVNKQPKRFENESHAARAAIVYALNQRTFLEYEGWYDRK